ncbi:RNA chaperone ProQ [Gallaecimonas sp. GXIMD4217]|uniref:RNA chaperone ProQ n=1 Tax=Gallaecimonas sp. GXIMD4217 TaxID=3131927 RepID=UPI00311ABDA0
MEQTDKLPNTKAVIAFLAERFPQCFTLEGEAKPLKIGIFQELAERLAEESCVSKTQLRVALRHYTNSWRYLRSVKLGVSRVDLDGNDAGVIEEEHAKHALEALHESMRKAGIDPDKKSYKKPPAKPGRKPNSDTRVKGKVNRPKPQPVDAGALKVGDAVRVAGGKRPLPGTVVAIDKDSVQVQLVTGMVMHVKGEHLLAAKGE